MPALAPSPRHPGAPKSTGPERRGVAFLAAPSPSGELEFHILAKLAVDEALQFQFSQRFDRQGFPVRIAHEWTKSLVPR